MDVRERVGWNVRRLRVEKGMSQDHLAYAAEIERAYVGYLERGKRNATISTLEKVAKVLGHDVSELFAIPPKRRRADCPVEPGKTENLRSVSRRPKDGFPHMFIRQFV
ncbi:MAG: helix-turn-helix transcriptional regulator [Mesorhizobium sp.]|uniref:helix-turn-helix domain-containing protein n=1 Tax=Mesorhizobium sp. TaxID=1871066 RepID=UPI001211CF07|nr:helix-turn-helix transcriptional regulator [Mesorhizobium sp.]TIR28290.1 MAG: helix-turn-helix transcriptional regulator [Mesorhizobium sp.]TIS21334.1 MAG: helix-turn-helix transcriptional regulator [Mesorhizobium sp.]